MYANRNLVCAQNVCTLVTKSCTQIVYVLYACNMTTTVYNYLVAKLFACNSLTLKNTILKTICCYIVCVQFANIEGHHLKNYLLLYRLCAIR